MTKTDALPLASPAEVSAEVSDNAPSDAIRAIFVEDDDDSRERLAAELAKHGIDVRGISDAASLMAVIDDLGGADLILLDWEHLETSRIDLVGELRGRGVTLPVVFFPGRPLFTDEDPALEGGAVDFIDKGRGAVNLPRTPGAKQQLLCGKLTLRDDVSRAYWNGTDLNLTLGEYKIVHLLASNVGRFVTYRAIYDRLRHVGFIAGTGDDGYRANVRSAIRRIRKKFLDLDHDFDEIKNYTGFGYCWGQYGGLR